MTMAVPGFGGAKTGKKSFQSWKNFYIKENEDNVYRILPSMHGLAETDEWSVFYRDHNGYSVPNPQDPSKPWKRPFMCPQERSFKTKMIIKPCAKCDQIDQKKAALERIEVEAKTSNMSRDKLDTLAAPLRKWLRMHYVDGKWRVAVMNRAGEFGVLYVPHKAKLQIEALVEELKSRRVPIDLFALDEGVWLNFKRTGGKQNIGEVQYKVEVVQEEEQLPDGRTVYSIKTAPLSLEQAQTALKTIPDLRETTRRLSPEQIRQLVESDESPETVQAILEMPTVGAEASPGARSVTSAPVTTVSSSPPPRSEPKAQPVDEEEAALLAEFRAKRTSKTQNTTPVVTSAPVPTPDAAPVPDVNEDEFMTFMMGQGDQQ